MVSVAGELDVHGWSVTRSAGAPDVMDAPSDRLDLTGVEFLGSLGIGVLVSGCKRVEASGGMFSVRCSQNECRRVLEISGLIGYLHVDGT